MFRTAIALVTALTCAIVTTVACADSPAPQTQLCGGGNLWQQALDLDPATAPQADVVPAQSCADPTQIQEAGGCCSGHGGPSGCDAETHKVICADGKKSKSCGC
jgi:hypothetical protein